MVIEVDTDRIRRGERHFAIFMGLFSAICLLVTTLDGTAGLISSVGLTLNAGIWGLRSLDARGGRTPVA